MQDITVGFKGIDQTTDPEFYVQLLDEAGKLDSIQACKRETFALLNAQKGGRFLDVGCGTGEDVMALARLIGSGGRAIGVDKSETMIAEAKKRSAGSGLPVEWRVGDAQRLDFDDNTFDGCRAERVFIYVENPRKLLAEMIRVVRPGGRIVVFDVDADAMIFNTPDRALNRKVLHAICDSFPNGWIGRQLPALIRGAGLAGAFVIPRTLIIPLAVWNMATEGALKSAQEAGVLTDEEISTWLRQLEDAERQGGFFGAAQGFIVGGSKP